MTPAAGDRPVILAVGTSLTAGYGLDPDDAWPSLLQKRIDAAGLPHRVVNAGVSGETSAGALRRMDWLLRQPVAVFILETGANDMLRGQDVEATRANVDAILARARRQAPPPAPRPPRHARGAEPGRGLRAAASRRSTPTRRGSTRPCWCRSSWKAWPGSSG